MFISFAGPFAEDLEIFENNFEEFETKHSMRKSTILPCSTGNWKVVYLNHRGLKSPPPFEMSVLCVRAGVNERFVFEECQVPSMENKSRSSL
jgi:hypothetical protein